MHTKFSEGKSKRKGGMRHRYTNIRMGLEEIRCERVEWIELE
jgi:hypothetical protein